MAKIGYSYWGYLINDFGDIADTPDGCRLTRRYAARKFLKEGHELICLQQRRELMPYPNVVYDNGFPDLDALILEWRWPTYKNSGQNKIESDLDRQLELLYHYEKRIPTIIWDQDYQLTKADELQYKNAYICEASLLLHKLTRQRYFLAYPYDFNDISTSRQHDGYYVYLGNNYERDQSFNKYYVAVAKNFPTYVHGNWMRLSPERDSPEIVLEKFPNIIFCDRTSFAAGLLWLQHAITTTHISKDIFYQHGHITSRFADSLYAGIPSLVPVEYYNAEKYYGKEYVVENSEELNEKIVWLANMSIEQRFLERNKQSDSLRQLDVGIDDWYKTVRKLLEL